MTENKLLPVLKPSAHPFFKLLMQDPDMNTNRSSELRSSYSSHVFTQSCVYVDSWWVLWKTSPSNYLFFSTSPPCLPSYWPQMPQNLYFWCGNSNYGPLIGCFFSEWNGRMRTQWMLLKMLIANKKKRGGGLIQRDWSKDEMRSETRRSFYVFNVRVCVWLDLSWRLRPV